MVSYKNYFLIKGMSLWNALTSRLKQGIYRTSYLFSYLSRYFHKGFYLWYIHPQHTLPLPYGYLRGESHSEWSYDPTTHQMIHLSTPRAEHYKYRLAWLSGRVTMDNTPHEMDAFLDNLRIKTAPSQPPSLHTLLMAWSAHHQKWLCPKTPVKVEWMDAYAEEHTIDWTPTQEPPLLSLIRTPPFTIKKIEEENKQGLKVPTDNDH